MNIIQITIPIILGIVVGLTMAYFLHLWSKYKGKKNVLKKIQEQEQQEFIIPKKDKKDSNYKGEKINLSEYVGLSNQNYETVKPDLEYNAYYEENNQK